MTLPLMYLLFYVSKSGCSDEVVVTRRLFLGTGAYVLAGMVASAAHLGSGYMVFLGRWWYNTAILFPLGYLYGRKGPEAWAWMRGSYRKQVACSVSLIVGSLLLSLVFWVVFSLVTGLPATGTAPQLIWASVVWGSSSCISFL